MKKRTLKGVQRSAYCCTGRLFSRMHRVGEVLIEPQSGLPSTRCGNVHRLAEAERCPAEWPRWSLAIADANGDHGNAQPLPLGQLHQTNEPLMQPDRSIRALDLPLREDHQLLACLLYTSPSPRD